MWRYAKFSNVTKWILTSLAILVSIFILIGIIAPSNGNNSTQSSTNTNTTAKAVKTSNAVDSPQVTKYKAEMKPLIQQFVAEEQILNADKSTLPHQDDPVYQQASMIYGGLLTKLYSMPGDPPKPYSDGYSTFLANIFSVMSDSTYDMIHPDTSSGSPQFNHYAVIGMKTAEDDMKIAEKMQPTHSSNEVDGYNGYGSMIDELLSLSQQVSQ